MVEKQRSEAAKASDGEEASEGIAGEAQGDHGRPPPRRRRRRSPPRPAAATKPAAKKPETAKPGAAKAKAPEAKAKAPAAKKPRTHGRQEGGRNAGEEGEDLQAGDEEGGHALRRRDPDSAKATGKSTAKSAGAVAEAGTKSVAADAPPAAVKQAAKKPPPFAVGDKVVYPHHGAATITAIRQMEFQGEKRPYYVLEVATDQLVVSVPVDGALELGVRPVISTNVARKVFATFREEPQEAGANWSRWYKLLTEKINSGDIFQVAEVVRDLTYAQQVKGISPALKRMLAKARLIIVSELRFALKLDEEDAIRRLDRALPRVDEPVEL